MPWRLQHQMQCIPGKCRCCCVLSFCMLSASSGCRSVVVRVGPCQELPLPSSVIGFCTLCSFLVDYYVQAAHTSSLTHRHSPTHTQRKSGRSVLLDFCYVLQLWRTFSAQVISSLFLSATIAVSNIVCACVCVCVCAGVCITIFYQFSKPLDERQFTPAVVLESSGEPNLHSSRARSHKNDGNNTSNKISAGKD